jgi:membrane protein
MALLKGWLQSVTLNKPLALYAKQEFSTPLFVLRETLIGFLRHNGFGMSASLSFYALFALIPLILLIFFLLSHLVFSSDYAIVKLAILTGNLVPEFSSKIMVEVYSATQTKAAWGALGLFLLLWAITPLASSLRATFYTIATINEAPSYFKAKLGDVLSVLGILLLFFLFTAVGFVIEKTLLFIGSHIPFFEMTIFGTMATLALVTIQVAIFYKIFFPMRISYQHATLGALLTVSLWILTRHTFGLFLSFNEHYGAVFGGMKAMFLSITWLYLNFAVFLLGTELIATLLKKNTLLIRGLFDDVPNKTNYIQTLMRNYGLDLKQGDVIFERGNQERTLFYLVEGTVKLVNQEKTVRELSAGDYFGELSVLSEKPTTSDAIVSSESAQVIAIYAEYIDALLADEPKIVMRLLKQIAGRYQQSLN